MRSTTYGGGKFVWIWEKYRPVILKMMISASGGPQEYQLSAHEFKDANNKKQGGYAFLLKVFKGKSENDIRKSAIAQDMLHMLNQSNTACELMDEASFEIEFDRSFMLNIRQISTTSQDIAAGQEAENKTEGP